MRKDEQSNRAVESSPLEDGKLELACPLNSLNP